MTRQRHRFGKEHRVAYCYLLLNISKSKVADTTLRFAENPDLATGMGRNGRIFVLSHFEFKNNVKLQIGAYRHMMSSWK